MWDGRTPRVDETGRTARRAERFVPGSAVGPFAQDTAPALGEGPRERATEGKGYGPRPSHEGAPSIMIDQSTEQRLKDRKILIVDDDPEVLESIKQALEAEGARIRTCGDGNSAVRICESESPELVVLDMMLPKRSGFLVMEKVKRLPEAPLVVMVTANEGKRHQQYAETLGVDGYLLKPVRLERLITVAMELLGKRDDK